ncbi:hypothetical protein KC316_g17742 [Hortaea werneckii]|nr:hypothetical protein KC316_g17742 [Hortaea werneckii]
MYIPDGPEPNLNFSEGLFIDYRHFDQAGIEPRFEFGYGMSHTTFSYSDLRVAALDASNNSIDNDEPTHTEHHQTTARPTVCPHPTNQLNASAYTFPSTISSISDYIYPYLPRNGTFTIGPEYPSASVYAERSDTPAGGASALWDDVFVISCTISNTGKIAGQEVAQLYLSLGQGEPVRQLRGFNKTCIEAGKDAEVSFTLKRRDLSIWDSPSQSWMDVRGLGQEVGVFVGASSRDLRLNGSIPALVNGDNSGQEGGASLTTSESSPIVTELSDGQPEVPVMTESAL